MSASTTPRALPRPLKVGVGGPVGSGKTALVERLSRLLRDRYDMAVITNDIYTQEDAQFLIRRGALAAERAPADLWSFTPGQDIQGMLHERMDARLFRS